MFVHFVVFELTLHTENRQTNISFRFQLYSQHHNGNSDKIEKEKKKISENALPHLETNHRRLKIIDIRFEQ